MLSVNDFARIEARCPFASLRRQGDALYGREWEVCSGTLGVNAADAADLIKHWNEDDKNSPGKTPEYRYVEGRVLTDAEFAEWLDRENILGRSLTDAEFIASLES